MKMNLAACIGLVSAIAALPATPALAEQWGSRDKLQDFVSRIDVLTNARAIGAKNLNSAKLAKRPWSSTFWPDLLGSVNWRYTVDSTSDASYNLHMILGGWGAGKGRILNNSTFMSNASKHRDIMSYSQEELDAMSPGEKYDIVMGDHVNYTFFNKVISRIDQLERLDLLATWAGVCHGWAPASLTMDRPDHGVVMASPSGRVIRFWPDDIKALASFAWGTAFGGDAQDKTKVEGWQCQTGATTNKWGRLLDPRCADVNPAFFHLVAINQIGLNQRGFVMDRNYRAEVQNQPTFAYQFKYFKVTDRHPTAGLSFDGAKVLRASASWDPYKEFRSKKSVALVGVEATLWYGHEEYHPSHASWTDNASKDQTKTLTIRYDLELDANDEIVGGEWREYDNAGRPTLAQQVAYQHPDIMWLVPPGLKPQSPGDADITSAWDGTGTAPADWRTAALKSARKTYADRVRGHEITRLAPQPLTKFVDLLLARSKLAK